MDANMEQASSSAPQRLIITEMVLENFKSYAGEQRVGPFHKARTLYRKRWHLCLPERPLPRLQNLQELQLVQ